MFTEFSHNTSGVTIVKDGLELLAGCGWMVFSDVFSLCFFCLSWPAQSLCVPLPVCKFFSCNRHIRSGLRAQSWAHTGFTDMCVEVRGYRDEMTLIGQPESVVCPEKWLGCDVKGEGSGIMMVSHACVGCQLQFDFRVVWSDMTLSLTVSPTINKKYRYVLVSSVRLTDNVLLSC